MNNKCDGCKFYCNGRCFGEKNAPYVEYADCKGENNKPMNNDELITHNDELITHIFELTFALDTQSAGKDYISLRQTHYNNQKWIHDNGYQEEYYQFFIKKLREEES